MRASRAPRCLPGLSPHLLHLLQGSLRAGSEAAVTSGFIWDCLPVAEDADNAIDFRRLWSGVKINKFPGVLPLKRWNLAAIILLVNLHIFRKDLLCENFRAMQEEFGREAFGFHPDTFQLPQERAVLKKRMKEENYRRAYMVKLPNSYMGNGASVINNPKKVS